MAGFAQSVLHQLKTQPAARNLPYALGRFPLVRGVYGRAIGLLQRAGAITGLKAHEGVSVFGPADVPRRVAELERDAGSFGLDLPAPVVAEIMAAVTPAPLRQWQTGRVFTRADVRAGRFGDGQPAVLADVVDAALVPAVQRVARDPVLLDVVSGYLGYRPLGCDPRVLWSFAGDYSDDERHAIGQTFEYHFDVHSYNFTYANFYLVDVDADAGAHVMVLGSHKDKPGRWLLGSARRGDASIEVHYGPERIKTITGPAGAGFVQDSSCYHKVLAPRARDRVMLHIRYY